MSPSVQKWTPATAWVLGGFAAFLLVFITIGASMLVVEQRRLRRYIPVTATVLDTRVEARTGRKGTRTHLPVITYRYYVGDEPYVSSRVHPLSISQSGTWARDIVERYKVGGTYTAYRDPSSPGDAFLVKTWSMLPWMFIVVPGIILLLVGYAFLSAWREERARRGRLLHGGRRRPSWKRHERSVGRRHD